MWALMARGCAGSLEAGDSERGFLGLEEGLEGDFFLCTIVSKFGLQHEQANSAQ
jgi:hypothetical protein